MWRERWRERWVESEECFGLNRAQTCGFTKRGVGVGRGGGVERGRGDNNSVNKNLRRKK